MTLRNHRVVIILRVILIAAAWSGAWVCGTLLSQHDGGWQSGPQSGSTSFLLNFCKSDSTSAVNCQEIVGSRFGSFDFSFASHQFVVPTSFIGLAFFVSVGLWFALLDPTSGVSPLWPWRITFLYLSVGLVGSLFFLGNMFFSLESWCPLCVTAHVINGLMFMTALLLRSAHSSTLRRLSETRSLSERRVLDRPDGLTIPGNVWIGVTAVVSIIVVCAGLWSYYQAVREVQRQWHKRQSMAEVVGNLQANTSLVRFLYESQPIHDFETAAGSMAAPIIDESTSSHVISSDEQAMPDQGNYATSIQNEYAISDQDENNVSVIQQDETIPTLIVFTDYHCSACKCFDSYVSALVNRILDGPIIVRYCPIAVNGVEKYAENRPHGEGDGSRYDKHNVHDDSEPDESLLQPFLAVEAARQLGGDQAFQQMHRLIFQNKLQDRDYVAFAKRIGLSEPEFRKAVQSQEVRAVVDRNMHLAKSLGITTTPTLFLEGRRVPDLCVRSQAFWTEIVDRAYRPKVTLTRLDQEMMTAEETAIEE